MNRLAGGGLHAALEVSFLKVHGEGAVGGDAEAAVNHEQDPTYLRIFGAASLRLARTAAFLGIKMPGTIAFSPGRWYDSFAGELYHPLDIVPRIRFRLAPEADFIYAGVYRQISRQHASFRKAVLQYGC